MDEHTIELTVREDTTLVACLPYTDRPVEFGARAVVPPEMVTDPPVLAAHGRHILERVLTGVGSILTGEVVQVGAVPVVRVDLGPDDEGNPITELVPVDHPWAEPNSPVVGYMVDWTCWGIRA